MAAVGLEFAVWFGLVNRDAVGQQVGTAGRCDAPEDADVAGEQGWISPESQEVWIGGETHFPDSFIRLS